MAYRLELPSVSKIHNVFHVSQLKAFHGVLPQAVHIPRWMQGKHTEEVMIPAAVIDKKVVKFQNQAQVQYLVHWVGRSPDFVIKFPDFVIQDVPVG